MHVVILTEGSYAWGVGHLHRCLAFAKSFQARGIQTKWLVVGDRNAESFFESQQCGEAVLMDWHDCVQLDPYLQDCFCAIVDSYHAPIECYNQIARDVP